MATEVLDRLVLNHSTDVRMLNIILDITRNNIPELYHPYIQKIITINPNLEVFENLQFFNNHFSSSGNQIWADHKADVLLSIYEYIRVNLPNPLDYLEHRDFLTRRIAAFKESADWERKLIFRGYR
ncbi:hypothetical protein ABDD95_07700 [Mucilaginibacter sp. PAMB04274]|uniref:hypothetical protein n=1 Tax=Mucilaginibacter sp. PAMB04274 TaxID=3138568 RepID=UPI0031F66267